MSEGSEMGDLWREYKVERQQKRASNRDHSKKILDNNAIPHEVKNGGAHLIVTMDDLVIDFWPGTGLWIVRDGKNQRHGGVRKLLKFIECMRGIKEETP